MPKISQLNPISQLTTSSILPVVDNGATQNVTLKRVVEFVSASIDVTFATEIELLQSASSITSSLNAFASSSILSVNSKLSTSSFEAYTASVQSVNTSSLLLSSSFNTFTSSYKTDSASFDSRIDNLELINVSPFLSSSTFNTYTSSNNTTNTTQNSRLTSLENNSGSYLLKTETGSFILSSQTSSFITEAETGSFLTSLPNNLISGSTQISNLGFATTSSVLNIDTSSLVTTSSFNSYTASISTASLVSRLNSIENVSGSYATTGSNTFVGEQTISGSQYISGSIILTNGAIIKDNKNSSIAFGKQAAEYNQGTQSVAIGNGAGNYDQNNGAVAVGTNAGGVNQGLRATAIGSMAGGINQGEYAVALGNFAGGTNQASHSIVINATGIQLNNDITSSLKIAPIRNITGSGVLQYDDITKEVSYSNIISGSTTFIGNQTIIDGNIYGNESAIILSTGQTSPAAAITVDISEVTIAFAGGAGKEWNIFSDGNTTYNGNLNGVLNLASTGSNTFKGNQTITGSLITTGGITGSILATNGVYSSSAQLPSGLVSGSSQVLNSSNVLSSSVEGFSAFSSSVNSRINSAGGGSTDVSMFLSQSVFNTFATSSFMAFSASVNTFTSSANTALSNVYIATASLNSKTGSYATTGSNTFIGTETISGSLLLSGSFSYNGTPLQNGFTFAQPTLTRILDNASYTGASAWTTSYTGSGGAIIVTANVSGYRSSIGSGTAQLLRDGVAVASQTFFFNIANYHTPITPLVYVSNSETGSHTYSIFFSNILADTQDYATINVLEYGNSAIISPNVISGSLQITNLGFATTSSVVNVNTSSLLLTSSFNTFATSSNTFSASVNSTTASLNTFSSSINTFTSSANTALSNVYITTASLNSKTGSYATTGSNQFNGNQSITGSLTINNGTIISSSLTTNSSSLYLNSGSNLYVQNNALVEITGSLNVRGTTRFETVGGDEGGEIEFGIPQTNTTLSTRVVTDIFQNRLRIFDGNTNGVFIDLSKAPTGVAGEITWKASGLVNRGVDVTLGNLKARIAATGNASLQLSTVSGTYSIHGSGIYSQSGAIAGTTLTTQLSVTTTPTYLVAGYNFAAAGATDTWNIYDTTLGIAWRITMIIGFSYNNNFISIERLH